MLDIQVTAMIYIGLWGLLALFCIISAHKFHPILYLMGGFFAFLFGWYLVNAVTDLNLFTGVYSIVFRSVACGFLLVIILIYLKIRKNRTQ